ncbi:DUF6083 domain-containing protein [Streptomyces sp. NPDC088197]|uniref:DUF6083 domain-containing protein n=1 Tax=Streptomyces sp. NPDC088197 TaxID=3365840 RepID=UPI0038162628
MRPNTAPAGCHWDGSPRTAPVRRPLRVATTSPSRLLRTGQSRRCPQCGNRIDLYPRTDGRPIALHPAELATAQVPAPCRWHRVPASPTRTTTAVPGAAFRTPCSARSAPPSAGSAGPLSRRAANSLYGPAA